MDLGDTIVLGFTVIISALTVIEKSQKIKWKPFSNFFGKSQIEEIKNIIVVLSEKIDQMSEREIEHYKKQAKILISGFATDLRNSEKCGKNPIETKSETEFISIMDLCEEYLDKKWNSKVKHDAEYIQKIYNSTDNCTNKEV